MTWLALALLFLLLPLGTTPMEGATILVGLAALASRDRRVQPLLGPGIAIWLGLLLAGETLQPGPLWSATLVAWSWVLLVVGPPVFHDLMPSERDRLTDVGLFAGAIAGIWAGFEVLTNGTPPWVQPVDGPFSHHLTLGYALLPALARALQHRRWVAAAAMGLGVACAGSTGPLLSTAILALALVVPAPLALAGGALATLLVVGMLAGDPELLERSVLWTAGTDVALSHPAGVGPAEVRAVTAVAQSRVMPGFHFPLHAHDSAIQTAAVAGWGAWIAVTWALVGLWRRTDRAGRAGIAAVVIGGLTQDTLGDLEVVRALCAWTLLPAVARSGDGPAAGAVPPPDAAFREPDPTGGVRGPATPESS